MTRDWTPEELEIIRRTPRTRRGRYPRKLTEEQVHAIRQRVDSLTQPWSIADLAKEYGVTVTQIARIARRQEWSDSAFEPEGRWWKEVELEAQRAEIARRRATENEDDRGYGAR